MEDNPRELFNFQIRNIRVLTHLLEHEAVSDEIIEALRENELDYFSLIDKIALLEKKVNVDEKTNLLKFKNDYLTTIIKTASRVFYSINKVDYPISFARFDIDNFSRFNNTYGHDVGDEVLVCIAAAIKEHSRPTDYVIRFGGEEIDVILPSTDLDGARVYMDKIVDSVRKVEVPFRGERLRVTVSGGLTSMLFTFDRSKVIHDGDIEIAYRSMQSRADDALYEAKYTGKDRYCIYQEGKQADYEQFRKRYVRA